MNLSKKRSCGTKTRHETQGAAEGCRRSMERRKADLSLHVYKCRHCKGWHVGHPSKGVQRGMRFTRLIKLIDKANRS